MKTVPAAVALLCLAFASLLLAPRAGGALTKVQAGMKAPGFVLKTLEGKPLALEKNLGQKGTVVVFWATWSPGSSRLLARLRSFHAQHGGEGLAVIGVNVENQTIGLEDREKIHKFAADLKVGFPVLLDDRLSTFHRYGVVAVPSTVVLDDKGIVVFELSGLSLIGGEELFDRISSIVGAGRPAAPPALAYHPDERAVREYNLGRQMIEKGMTEAGRTVLLKAADRDARFVPPVLLLARIMKEEGRLDEAAALVARSLERMPKNVALESDLARIRLAQGRTEEAARILSDVIRRDPEYAPAHCYLGRALKQIGDREGAIRECRLSQSLNPHNAESFELSAETIEAMGDLKQAAADYRKAVELIAGF